MRLMYLIDHTGRDVAVSPAHLVMIVRGDEGTLLKIAFTEGTIRVKEGYEEASEEWRRALTGTPQDDD